MSSVLIVGGGFAGLSAARALMRSKRHTVTLVDRKDYFEVSPAQLHQLVAPESLGDRPRFKYSVVLGEGFVQGEVVSLEANAAVLAQGQRLTFDILILSPGTRYPRLPLAKPIDHVALEQRRKAMLTENQRFRAAKSYLIIGGGLVGVELAGEIASAAPDKSIRLAHQGPRLVEKLSPRASEVALSQLRTLGVNVLLNTSNAQPVDGDLVYEATTPEPATRFLASVQPGILDDQGRILVNEHLQVQGYKHWYALGDATAAPDAKQAVAAAAQGKYVARAILGSTKPYRPQSLMILVALGAKLGFAQLPFGVVTWRFLVNLKRKDYLVGLIRKSMGAS